MSKRSATYDNAPAWGMPAGQRPAPPAVRPNGEMAYQMEMTAVKTCMTRDSVGRRGPALSALAMRPQDIARR